MSMVETITEKLEAALNPESLEVINESHMHAGHAGSPGTGESHFRVRITSAAFAGKSRLAMHQAVNQTLKEELKTSIHALAIEAKAP
jgi:BolA protein